MIKYRENRNAIIQSVEIDLTEISQESRQDLEDKINKYLDKSIFESEAGNKLVYKTEVLIPKIINKNRLNLLMVVGNPAVHSVAERMFFSYERRRSKENKETWIEHRFWRALRDCCVLKFDRNIEKPTPENIKEINYCKRNCLLNREYESKFNIFILPYFSFPTPASDKKYGGVAGITKIVGKEIFKEMKEFEFQRFKGIVLCNDIKKVICFQKTDAGEEIIQKAEGKPIGNIGNAVYELSGAFKSVTLYIAPPTRVLHTKQAKERLKSILASVR